MAEYRILTTGEEFILRTVRHYGKAYGIEIRDKLYNLGIKHSAPFIYDVLNRMEKEGLVTSFLSGKESKRGGRAKKYYSITIKGINTLIHLTNLRDCLRQPL